MRTTTFGYTGDGGLGDRLLAAALRGEKTATSSLAVEYLYGEPLPRVGEQSQLVDHDGHSHGLIETTRIRILPLNEVGEHGARDEGEGFVDVVEFRQAHVEFRHDTAQMIRDGAGDPSWVLRESEPVVVEWFRLLDQDDVEA